MIVVPLPGGAFNEYGSEGPFDIQVYKRHLKERRSLAGKLASSITAENILKEIEDQKDWASTVMGAAVTRSRKYQLVMNNACLAATNLQMTLALCDVPRFTAQALPMLRLHVERIGKTNAELHRFNEGKTQTLECIERFSARQVRLTRSWASIRTTRYENRPRYNPLALAALGILMIVSIMCQPSLALHLHFYEVQCQV